MNPEISVILIFYNDADYLAETIRSILKQTYQNFELLMYNNGSTDGSHDIAKDFAKQDERITIIHSAKNYHNGSLNFRKLLKETKGKYIRFFCADDVMYPECLEKQLNFLENHKNHIACFAHLQCIDDNSRIIKQTHKSAMKDNRFAYLNHLFYSYSVFAFPTALVRKKNLKEEMLDPRLIQFSDSKLWLEVLKQGECYVLDDYLVQYRLRKGEGNVSNLAKSRGRLNSFLFELEIFYEEFFKFTNLKEYKAIFPEAEQYLKKIGNDKELLPFITAILLYNSEKFKPFHFSLHRDIALKKMFQIISDEKLAKKISDKLELDYLTIYQLTRHYHEGLDYDYSRIGRNLLCKLYYKLISRKKYKKLASLNHLPN